MPNAPALALANELYELMTSDGATPAVIREMPGLMNLAYIRAELTGVEGNVQEDAVAATVRDFIEQATYALEEPLSQRDNKDADRGAAARCLLGLQQGTDSMLLWERRQRAAGYLVKDVRTITKRREVKGRVVSQEELLMERLANHLWSRETDFLRTRTPLGADPQTESADRWLPLVQAVWQTAGDLESSLGRATNPGLQEYLADAGEDLRSLHLYAWFWKFLKPAEPEHISLIGKPEAPMLRLFPPGLLAELTAVSPFSQATIQHLVASLTTPDQTYICPTAVMWEVIEPWREWLRSCACDQRTPDPECRVDRFRHVLLKYREQTRKCWDSIRDPSHDPDVYALKRTPIEWLEWYYIVPNLDNITVNKV